MSEFPRRGAVHRAIAAKSGFVESFGLADADVLLAVGSHLSGTADNQSDVDFLAVYKKGTRPPKMITQSGSVSLANAISENWVARFAGREINVEAVAESRITELGDLLRPVITHSYAPMFQPFDIRVLDRVRTGLPMPIGGRSANMAYLEELRVSNSVTRLPAALLVMYLGSAIDCMQRAKRYGQDRYGMRFVLENLADNAVLATLCLYGMAPYSMKKAVSLLNSIQRENHDSPLTVEDLDALCFEPNRDTRLEMGRATLNRICRYIEDRAAEGDPVCAQAQQGLRAYTGLAMETENRNA